MANRSPPTPFETGSINPSVALAAMAASTALPPRFRISRPTWVASGHAGANHAVPRQDFRARGKVFAGDAIDLGVERKSGSEKERGRGRSKTDKRGHGRRLRRLLGEENRPFTTVPSWEQIAADGKVVGRAGFEPAKA